MSIETDIDNSGGGILCAWQYKIEVDHIISERPSNDTESYHELNNFYPRVS